MTPSQSTPNGGPVTVAGLATELGVLPSWVADHAASLEAQRPRMPAVYLAKRDRLLSGEAADAIRELYREQIPDPAQESGEDGDLTVTELARRLGRTPEQVRSHADNLEAGRLIVWVDRGRLSQAAADAVRETVRAEKQPTPDITHDTCRVQFPHPAHNDIADDPRNPFTFGAMYRCPGVQVPMPDQEQIASLLIRQDMALVDEGCGTWVAGTDTPDTSGPDQQVMRWAVGIAGHLFDQHTLWDYALVNREDHVHKCFDHRHDGPLTRGLVRRG